MSKNQLSLFPLFQLISVTSCFVDSNFDSFMVHATKVVDYLQQCTLSKVDMIFSKHACLNVVKYSIVNGLNRKHFSTNNTSILQPHSQSE